VIEKIVYVILIGIMVYIFLELEDDLRNDDYYRKDYIETSRNSFGLGGRFFFIGLIFPWGYFRKDKLLEGWSVYFFSLIAFFSALYFFIKLVGLI
jgi:hypothetical protein